MSTKDNKSVDFNPLDILASAAASLNQVDKKMTQLRSASRNKEQSDIFPAEEIKSSKSKKSQDGIKGVKKIRVVTTLSSDLEKMLDEHNYGNSRKSIIEKSWPDGQSSSGDMKDRKVVVTVINKTGDHHVIRTLKASDTDSTDCNNSNELINNDNEETENTDTVKIDGEPVDESRMNSVSDDNETTTSNSEDTAKCCCGVLSEVEGEFIDICEKCRDRRKNELYSDSEAEGRNCDKLGSDTNSGDNDKTNVASNVLSPQLSDIPSVNDNKSCQSNTTDSPSSKCDTNNVQVESKVNIVRSLLTCEKDDVKCPETVLSLSKIESIAPDTEQETENINTESGCVISHNDSYEKKDKNSSDISVDISSEGAKVTEGVNVDCHQHQHTVSLDSSTCVPVVDNCDNDKTKTEKVMREIDTDDLSVNTTDQSDFNEKDSEETETIQLVKTTEDNVASIDHCYAETTVQGPQRHRKNTRLQSTESLLSDLSQDSGFAENSPGTPNYSKTEIQQRIGSPELKPATRVISTSPLLISSSSSDDTCNKFSSLFEIGSSGISSLQDLNDVNKTRDAIIALVQSENFNSQKSAMSPVKSNPISTNSNLSPKIGKYRIGTFASVSNSNYGLESPKKKPTGDTQKQVRTSGSTSLLSKLNMVSSKSKNDDVGKPVETAFHVEHDHDYCLPAAAISSSPHLMAKLIKDTPYMKQTNVKLSQVLPREKRSDSVSSDTTHKRPRKGSAASDFNENSMDVPSPSSVVSDSPLSPSEVVASQSSMSTRQRVKAEKAAEYVRSGNSASKLKITGKFQDDYIYFLNTKVRSRRRTNSQDIPAPIPSDRILVPAPKPGDIVVPHLTDADLEAIKRGQHSGAKPPSSLSLVSTTPSHSNPARTQQLTSTPLQNASNSVTSLSSPSTTAPSGSMTDEESKIINTILSMETGDNNAPSTSVVSELAGDIDTTVVTSAIPSNDGFGLNFIPEQLNLTSEQMEILYSAMDEVQSLSPDSTSNKFPPESENVKDEKKEGLPDHSKSQEEPIQESGEKDTSVPASDSEEKEERTDKKVDIVTPKSHLTVKSLLTDPGKSQAENKSVVTPPSVPSLLQNDTGSVKSLINSSVELPSGSVVNTIPDIPFTSLEKSSLDLFGNDLKLFPEASVPETTLTTTVPSTTSVSNDYNAPWIVTVSMYWNDLPAIMINNLPFVRLVDIHKQILPAKDTGILKKRCQLLGINVLNCSEMQRYFLVQYGKAFNSKSTLIVGKDDAKALIGYYVNPVPKPHKTEEAKSSEPELKVCKPSKSRTKSQSAEQRLCNAPATPELPAPVDQVEEPVLVAPCQSEGSQEVPSKITSVPPATDRAQQGGQRISQRTRHKKINFLEMLKGDANNNTTSSGQGDLKVEEEEVLPPVDQMVVKEETNDVIEKVQKKSVKRKNSPVNKDLSSKEKTAKQVKSKVESEALDLVNTSKSSESETENKEVERFPLFVGKRGTKQGDREQMVKKLKTVKPKKPGSLKVKWTIFNKTNSKNPGILTGNDSHKNSGKSDSVKSEILAVIHKDIVSRNGDKRHMQAGNLFLDQYNGKDAACVRCCTCKKLFSVDMFLTHLHEIGGSGKLLVINQPQMIALRDMYPSENQKRMWQCFQKRRRALSVEKSEDAIKKTEITTEKNLLTGSVQHTGHNNGSVKNSLGRSRVPPITATTNRNNNVRISGRKRKQKQLYPIENYSFSKKAQQAHSISTNVQIDSDGDEPMSPLTYDDSDSCGGSPTKVQRLCKEGIPLEDGTASTSNVLPESVLTIANGPEVISFTALQHDEGLDV